MCHKVSCSNFVHLCWFVKVKKMKKLKYFINLHFNLIFCRTLPAKSPLYFLCVPFALCFTCWLIPLRLSFNKNSYFACCISNQSKAPTAKVKNKQTTFHCKQKSVGVGWRKWKRCNFMFDSVFFSKMPVFGGCKSHIADVRKYFMYEYMEENA